MFEWFVQVKGQTHSASPEKKSEAGSGGDGLGKSTSVSHTAERKTASSDVEPIKTRAVTKVLAGKLLVLKQLIKLYLLSFASFQLVDTSWRLTAV